MRLTGSAPQDQGKGKMGFNGTPSQKHIQKDFDRFVIQSQYGGNSRCGAELCSGRSLIGILHDNLGLKRGEIPGTVERYFYVMLAGSPDNVRNTL